MATYKKHLYPRIRRGAANDIYAENRDDYVNPRPRRRWDCVKEKKKKKNSYNNNRYNKNLAENGGLIVPRKMILFSRVAPIVRIVSN